MKKLLVTLLLALTFTQLSANAFDFSQIFKWLFFGYNTAQTTTITTEDLTKTLNDITSKTKSTDESVNKAFLSVVSMLSTQNEAKKIEDEYNSIFSSNLTNDEKNIKFLNLVEKYITTLRSNKLTTILTIKSLSDKEKSSLTSSIQDMVKYSQEYTTLSKKGVDTASKVVSTLDDEQVKILKEINTASSSLTKRANVLSDFATQVKTLSTLAGLKFQ